MSGRDSFTGQAIAAELTRMLAEYRDTRAWTVALCDPLSPEDCQAQSMADASPAKWHLAHTTWFFETFILVRFAAGYSPAFESYRILFNSYYNAVGEKHPRPQRGLLTRPTLAEVLTYRKTVDDAMNSLIADGPSHADAVSLTEMLMLGLQHEQQHQELILTDLKHLLSCNPLGPAYRRDGDNSANGRPDTGDAAPAQPGPGRDEVAGFLRFDGGVTVIGTDGNGILLRQRGTGA